MKKENVLLRKRLRDVQHYPFASRKWVTLLFTDGTLIKMSKAALNRAYKARRINKHNTQMIRVAFSPIP